ncbi:MAG: hypothetical protein PHN23_02245 [Methanocorpusculum sp.]|nr:hypothetical protein [Methanocorpusculum sp.]
MKKIAVFGMILLACVFAAGCAVPGTTPDPIVGIWSADDPMQFNDSSFTYVFHPDGTGNALETSADPAESSGMYNITWRSTGEGTYEAISLYELVFSEDKKAFTILGDGSGDRFIGDGFVGVWMKETPEEFDGVLYEARFAFYEDTTGSFSWHYLNNGTQESSYPLVWSAEDGVYRYWYPDDLSTFTIGADGVLTERWGDGVYTYTRV